MAELQVGKAQQYQTLNAAIAAAKPGDTLNVAPGMYSIARQEGVVGGTVKVDVAGLTIRGDGGQVVLRGNWGPWLLDNPFGKSPTMPDARSFVGFADYGGVIQVAADGVTIENVTIEAVPCAGFDVTARHGFTLRNCATYWTMNAGLVVKPGGDGLPRNQYARDITVEDCRFLMASCGSFDPAWVARRNAVDAASGVVRMGLIEGPVTFRRNVVAGCPGEGFDVGKGVYGTPDAPILIEDNWFGDTAHSCLYFNHVDGGAGEPGVVARNNVIFVTSDHPLWAAPPGNAGRQLAFRDERPDKFFQSRNILCEGNIIIGGDGVLVSVRDGRAARDVRLRHNTIVAGERTGKESVIMSGGSGVFERNVVVDNGGAFTKGGEGFAFQRNGWSSLPVERMRSTDDVMAAGGALVAPFAPLRLPDRGTAYPATAEEYMRRFIPAIDQDNYRPVVGGPLVVDGAAVAGALGPDGPEPPIEPPPPGEGPDWDALMALAAAVGEQVAAVNMAAEAAADALGELLLRLAEYQAA